ncbi:MAG: hypothetical protein EOO46_00040 [Flavobacterium sp.]|nr:MAG: hypothetical protein EOO46_00040 [Flavobacterium sp.]
MYLPYLSTYHTIENSQGTLDPLGLYSIADKLATRLAPGLRERMKHPRYLTAIAVGSVVGSSFEENELARDEVSEPWQVYEWYVTSGLVKKFEKEDPSQLLGMPGREKTTNALKSNLPLSANRYLKTPSVFGFHGVYRTLAKQIGLIEGNLLGEFGYRLTEVWENEQNLKGFLLGVKGSPGNEFRSRLYEAVRRGLEIGEVAKPWSWEFYSKIGERLSPKSPGNIEATLLYNELIRGESGAVGELINFLISKAGRRALLPGSEKTFHELFLQSSIYNRELLKAIQAYERVARLLYNAFYDCLHWMAQNQSKGKVAQLASLHHILVACKELPVAFTQADLLLEPFSPEAHEFAEKFEMVREIFSAPDWVKLLFEHHSAVQRAKPPNGKASWILEHTSGSYLLNTLQSNRQLLNNEYVHQYRTFALQSFMKDLNKI